ncbi:MAG TPA: serine/threonine-protein kinase [Planctomycetota bacterium]|jgi:serine/threonine protein kinase/WD40 repeat protein|nr:serine/threonine-protein kinase [Planctomycetota bacterium]
MLPEDSTPRTIGPYRLVEVIGEGGMGKVYLAEQREPVRRQVALKIVSAELGSEEVVARFEAERQALALMSHPNIAQVFDAGRTEDGRPYFAMEYVPGLPITEYCDARALDLDARLRLFADVCRGVHHAHARGIIHRDLKPSNLLVAQVDGRPAPKIIDFGIAKATWPILPDGAAFAELGRLLGTPAYASPEQARITPLGVDTRTDIYSLGVVLYELLVGERPFDATASGSTGLEDLQRRIAGQSPTKPSTRLRRAGPARQVRAAHRGTKASALLRRLRGDLDSIVMRAIEKDPERRYPSASELAADLERHLRHEPVDAGPRNLVYLGRKYLRRHRPAAIAASAILLSLLGGLTASLSSLRAARASAKDASLARDLALAREGEARANLGRALEAERSLAGSLDRERTALREAVGRRLSSQSVALADEDPTLALLLAIEGAERAPGEEANTTLYDVLAHACEAAAYPGHDGPVRLLEASPDGRLLLTADDTFLVLVWEAASGRILHRIDLHDQELTRAGFLAGGRTAFTASRDGRVYLIELAGGSVLRTLEHPSPVLAAAPSPDGRTLFTGCEDGIARAWALDEERPPETPLRLNGPVKEIAVSRDGSRIAAIGAGSEALLDSIPASGNPIRLALSSREPRDVYNLDLWYPPGVWLSPDGSRLLTRARSGEVVLWDGASGEALRRFTGPEEFVAAAGMSPDGSTIFLLRHAREGPFGEIREGRRGDPLRALLGAEIGERGQPHFSPDGGTLATAGNPWVDVWDVSTGRHRSRLSGDPHGIYAPRFLSGDRVAAGGHDGALRTYRISSFLEWWRVAGLEAGGALRRVAGSPDGELAIGVRREADGSDGPLELLDGRSGRRLLELLPEGAGFRGAGFDAAGERLAVAGGEPPRLRVWDLTARRVLLERPGEYSDLSFAPDGSRLLAKRPGAMDLFDLASGGVPRAVEDPEGRAWRVALSPDASRAVSADGRRNTATVWDLATGKPVRVIEHHGFVFRAAFDPTGRFLATFANDTSAKILDGATLAPLRVLTRLPTTDDAALAFSPDGRLLAIGTDSVLLAFETETGRLFARWSARRDRVKFESFSPDGLELLVQLGSGPVRAFPLDPLAHARRLSPRRLRAAEMERFDLGAPEERAVREREETGATVSARGFVRLAQVALARGEIQATLDWLERASKTRRRMPAPYFLTLASAHARRAASRPATPEGESDRNDDVERALAALRLMVEEGASDPRLLETTPDLEGLRSHPEFAQILARMKR